MATRADAFNVSGRLLDALSRSAAFDGIEIGFSASVGVAFFSGEATATEDLLHRADAAMYSAKQAGGGQVVAL